ncbi:MAG: type III pantothenate kinase [Alphaproteobacteria bacterium]|nr:type III pantothenate kinase [Alphaproteobacteria bacterium]
MLLAIDAGNTNIVFALIKDDKVLQTWRSATDIHRTADDYGVWLTQLMAIEKIDRTAITEAIIATVVPETLFSLKQFCRRYCKTEPMVIGDGQITLPCRVLIDNPEELGADRLVNAIAAHRRYHGPLIVVDFGTATTFDCVNENGDYIGGVIAPGINLSLQALYQAAAKLPRIAIKQPRKILATNTINAMQSGIFWGYIGLIEGVLSRLIAELSEKSNPSVGKLKQKIIATGGLAPLFSEATQIFDHIDPELTLFGLSEISKHRKD